MKMTKIKSVQDFMVDVRTNGRNYKTMRCVSSDGRVAVMFVCELLELMTEDDIGSRTSLRVIMSDMHEAGKLKPYERDYSLFVERFKECAVKNIGDDPSFADIDIVDIARLLDIGAHEMSNFLASVSNGYVRVDELDWNAVALKMYPELLGFCYETYFEHRNFDYGQRYNSIYNMTDCAIEIIRPGLGKHVHAYRHGYYDTVVIYRNAIAGKTRLAAKMLGVDGALMHITMRPDERIPYQASMLDGHSVSALLKGYGELNNAGLAIAHYYGDAKKLGSAEAADTYKQLLKLNGIAHPHGFTMDKYSATDFVAYCKDGITEEMLQGMLGWGITMEDVASIAAKWDDGGISMGQAAFLAHNDCDSEFAESTMPDVVFEHDGWIMRRMPKSSPLQFQVGTFASCCQHIGGASESLLLEIPFQDNVDNYYVSSPNGTGIADMVVWRTTDGDYVIDSIEGRGLATDELMAKFVMDFANCIPSDSVLYVSASEYGVTDGVCDIIKHSRLIRMPTPVCQLSYTDADDGVYAVLLDDEIYYHEPTACRGTARNGRGK